MTTQPARTPLYDWHVAHGGRMVDFAGWSMPVQYTSIADEHHATRRAVGVFDISHMGRLQFHGPQAVQLVDSVVTRRVTDIKPTQVRYALICNAEGGILDDVLVYAGAPDGRPLSIVVNASNREKILAWIEQRSSSIGTGTTEDAAASIRDVTLQTAMIAVQGPRAVELMQRLAETPFPLADMRYYTCATCTFDGIGVVLSRTGYTGEDGIEIICDAENAVDAWEYILEEVEVFGGMAAGLGARDTLRLEAAMPLYGHELSETINPFQARLGFAVDLEGHEFIGRAALERLAEDSNQTVRVGLLLDGKRVPRQGCAVLHNGETFGEVTSGTFSPTLERPIAMAYVRPSARAIGTRLVVDIRGTQHAAVVVPLPFYKRTKSN